ATKGNRRRIHRFVWLLRAGQDRPAYLQPAVTAAETTPVASAVSPIAKYCVPRSDEPAELSSRASDYKTGGHERCGSRRLGSRPANALLMPLRDLAHSSVAFAGSGVAGPLRSGKPGVRCFDAPIAKMSGGGSRQSAASAEHQAGDSAAAPGAISTRCAPGWPIEEAKRLFVAVPDAATGEERLPPSAYVTAPIFGSTAVDWFRLATSARRQSDNGADRFGYRLLTTEQRQR
uniref:SAM-dependent methyltransferase n=1 Tax=Macrostomum lignano TaxID=282301 RepID=A0A1I8FIL1_9PLAT